MRKKKEKVRKEDITAPLVCNSTIDKSRFGYVTNLDFLHCLKREFKQKGIDTHIKNRLHGGVKKKLLVYADPKDLPVKFDAKKDIPIEDIPGENCVLYDEWYHQ